MDRDRVAENLTVVESHFHSEALNEVEVAQRRTIRGHYPKKA